MSHSCKELKANCHWERGNISPHGNESLQISCLMDSLTQFHLKASRDAVSHLSHGALRLVFRPLDA